VIDGTGVTPPFNVPVPQPSATYPASAENLVVDTVSDKIYLNGEGSFYLTVVDASNGNTVTSIPMPTLTLSGGRVIPFSSSSYMALNPVTGKLYVSLDEGLAVVDGRADPAIVPDTFTDETVVQGPVAVAVDPQAKQGYVVNRESDNVTVVNGLGYVRTIDVTDGGTLSDPVAVAANPENNFVYVADAGDPTTGAGSGLMAFDGTDDSEATAIDMGLNPGLNPVAVAVDPATDMVYVANSRSNSVTAVDVDNNNQITTISVGTQPIALALDSLESQVYMANAGGGVSIIKEASNTVIRTLFDSTAITPSAVVASEYTHYVYVANKGSNTISLIQAPYTAITGGYAVGSSPVALATNLANKKVYVVNQGSNTVSVIDETCFPIYCGITTISVGNSPDAVTVNNATGTAYVANSADNTVSIIDGVYDTVIATVPTGAQPTALAADPIEGEIYVANFAGNDVTKILDASVNIQFPNQVDIAPLPSNLADSSTPTYFTFTAATPTPPDGLYYQLDTLDGPWSAANSSGGGAFTSNPTNPSYLAYLAPGLHILYAYATDGQEAPGSEIGQPEADAPGISGISAYAFTVGVNLPVLEPRDTSIPDLPISAEYESEPFPAMAVTDASTYATVTGSGGCSVSNVMNGPSTSSGTTTSFLVTMTSGTTTCTLMANWPADSKFTAGSVTEFVLAMRAAQDDVGFSVQGGQESAAYKSSFTVLATTNGDRGATITSNNTNVCTVGIESNTPGSDGMGMQSTATVTMESGTGICSLTATWPQDANFNAPNPHAPPLSVTAEPAEPNVKFFASVASTFPNSSFTVTATTNASVVATITGTPGVCSVSNVFSTSNGGGMAGMLTTATVSTLPGTTSVCGLDAMWVADENYDADSDSLDVAVVVSAPSSSMSCNGTFNGTFAGNLTVSNGQTCSFIGGASLEM